MGHDIDWTPEELASEQYRRDIEDYDNEYHQNETLQRCKCGHPKYNHGIFWTKCHRDCGCRKYIEFSYEKEGVYD